MSDDNIATTKRTAIAASAGGLVLLVGWFVWWARPPQIGPDKEAIKTVDALFTAFTSRNATRVANARSVCTPSKTPEDCRQKPPVIWTD